LTVSGLSVRNRKPAAIASAARNPKSQTRRIAYSLSAAKSRNCTSKQPQPLTPAGRNRAHPAPQRIATPLHQRGQQHRRIHCLDVAAQKARFLPGADLAREQAAKGRQQAMKRGAQFRVGDVQLA
jgi:hypothetical protein